MTTKTDHSSLATRNSSLTTQNGHFQAVMSGRSPTVERAGFHALDFTSSTHMAVSVRFHQEDPWERIRLVSAKPVSMPPVTTHAPDQDPYIDSYFGSVIFEGDMPQLWPPNEVKDVFAANDRNGRCRVAAAGH